MTIKHTLGPWRVDDMGRGVRRRIFIECNEVRDEEAEETWLAELAAGPRWEADARLMAAAPDLYEFTHLCAFDENYEVSPILREKARAAIKRAREG